MMHANGDIDSSTVMQSTSTCYVLMVDSFSSASSSA